MNRYQSYKPSGIEWIGDIPEEWIINKLGRIVNTKQGIQVDYEEQKFIKEEGYLRFLRISDYTNSDEEPRYVSVLNSQNYQVNVDDIVMFRYGDSGKVVKGIEGLICNNLFTIKTKNNQIENNYLFTVLSSDIVYQLLRNSSDNPTLKQVSHTILNNFFIPIPQLQEQHQIVQFLDEKTELIDTLISTKERKIILLKEQRLSLINQVVTKGLNSNIKMKDSGVEWIGEIPEGWIFKKLKHIFKYKKGFPFKSDDMGDEGIPIVKVTDIKNLTINKPKDYFTKEVDDRITRIKEKDIILTTVGSKMEVSNSSVGQLGLVGKEQHGFFLNQNTLCIRLKDNDNNVNFIFYLLQTNRFRGHLDIHSHGTVNQSSLNVEDILNYTFLVPHFNEQVQIVDYLDSKTKEIDDLVQLEQKKIDLLKDYRQSLILEVVTGKIKVTTDE